MTELKGNGKKKGPWVTRSSKLAFKTPFLTIIKDEVFDPAGKKTSYAYVHVAEIGVGIIPVTESGEIFLVNPYRYNLESADWEIVCGKGEKGENPLETAKRELKEETGIEALRYDLLCENLILSKGNSDERGNIYIARNLTYGSSSLDSNEVLGIKRVPIDEAIRMVTEGIIKDVFSRDGIFCLKSFFSKNEFVWKEEGV